MLRCFFVIPAVCFFLMFAFAASADLIVEPENDFYKRHAGKIIYLGRSFIANGKDGSVPVRKEPGLGAYTAKLQNGEMVYVQYSCLYNNDFWGFTRKYYGWVRMDEMLVLYDYVAFEEEHLSEFYPYTGDYAEIKENRSAIAWSWPGSGAYLWTFKDLDTENFRVSHAWRDKEGREWGFVSYLYNSRNIWICLSDPLNRDIPAFNPAPKPGVWESETEHIDVKQSKNSAAALIAALVAALAAGTIVLISALWKPNKTKSGVKNND